MAHPAITGNQDSARPATELLHDLQVHQVELEMQNEELRRAHLALEAARDRYVDLYDFAPVGYFTLNLHGVVGEANLTGAALLGMDRGLLIGSQFARRVVPADTDRWHRYITMLAREGERGSIELALQGPGGNAFHAHVDGLRARDQGGTQVLRITLTDISQRKAREEEITRLAYYDPLTGLPNRRLMKDRLHQAQALSARSGREGAVMFIDLDNFKRINDTLGHDKGDQLLQQVAQRLTNCVREGDTVARLGGDEFVVMLAADLSNAPAEAAAQAKAVGEKILAALARPYGIAGNERVGSASIGVVLFRDHVSSVDELLTRADQAMYQAKAAGRNTLRFFDSATQDTLHQRSELEADLRLALQRDELTLYYQPEVDDQNRLWGAEALLRWRHPRLGLVEPDAFISVAEEAGLIQGIGQWVLESACAQLATWAGDAQLARLRVSINISPLQLRDRRFVPQVLDVLDRSGANPEQIKLELTESMMLDNLDDTIAKMKALKAGGIGFSLDDFGTGYASLSHLKNLPLDQLKIDRSFVQHLLGNPRDAAIARTIVDLGRSLGLTVIAEGVETEAQHGMLAGFGCHVFQGGLFGWPQPVDALVRMAREASAIGPGTRSAS
jgi:diguanylate cyclase (GGDEF)-like protein/PAS domain S-box-containing protein